MYPVWEREETSAGGRPANMHTCFHGSRDGQVFVGAKLLCVILCKVAAKERHRSSGKHEAAYAEWPPSQYRLVELLKK